MSSNLVNLLGDTLEGKSGNVKTSDAVAGKSAIGLYFSAHWCPPCRGFTPKLAKTYTDALKGKGMEIVFISSDKEEQAFKEYHGEMPWLALPYGDRKKKEELSKKYKVQGIPTFVVLSPEGKLITTDGRSKLEDLDAYPWIPRPLSELLGDTFVSSQDGAAVTVGKDAIQGKHLGLYFSAHWCPPCRGFTPQLADIYKKAQSKAHGFEIIFVSSDRDEDGFKDYHKDMPWLALPYSKRKEKEELSSMFGVDGIPTLVILDPQFKVVNKNARSLVGSDPEAENFPWAPKMVNDIGECQDGLQDLPSLIVFAEELDKEGRAKVEADLTTVAKELKMVCAAADNKKEDGDEDGDEDEFAFFISINAEKGPTERIKDMCKIEEGSPVKAIILDIPNDGAFHEHQGQFANAEEMRAFLQQYRDGKLERKQLVN